MADIFCPFDLGIKHTFIVRIAFSANADLSSKGHMRCVLIITNYALCCSDLLAETGRRSF